MELYALVKSTILNSRYEILSLIGTGGFSLIYKAYDRELRSLVAIKEFFPHNLAERTPYRTEVLTRNREAADKFRNGMQLFKAEARRMAKLNGLHNTVNVLGTFDENNTSYIVMELMEGISLLTYLQSLPNSRFDDVDDAKQIIYSVAEALEYAHSRNILHRDVSPDNIFLCEDGKVKLLDFGAAREITQDGDFTVVVKSGCTPPEQYRKSGRQGPWTDLYALAATFYRMLTGVFPEPAPDRVDQQDCPSPSLFNANVPEYIDTLILRCLAYDYTLRLSRATDVMQVLHSETIIQLPGKVREKKRLFRVISYAAVSVLMVLFLIVGLLAVKKSETLYTIAIDECTIRVELPTQLSSKHGLAAAAEDFQTMYPQITVEYITDGSSSVEVDITQFTGDITGCEPLDEIQRLNHTADRYAIPLAFSAELVYWNTQKAFESGIDMDKIRSAQDIPAAYYAATYDEFLDETSKTCAFKGSVSLYRDVQKKLPGVYRIYPAETAPVSLAFSVSAGLSENQRNAAMRFLLYLTSQRAQEILFISHEGLIPAEENQRDHFFEVYSELVFLQE